jgi:hypothetical protein
VMNYPGQEVWARCRRKTTEIDETWKQYSGDRICLVSPGTHRNLAKSAAKYGHWIPASNS